MVKNDTKTVREIKNFDVPQTVRRVVRPNWEVKKLSVAVVVDGRTVRAPASADGSVPASVKNEAWTPEKLKEFESIVASAVGIDKKRGDSLEIKNMEFSHEDFEEANRIIQETERKSYVHNLTNYAIIGLAIMLFFFLVVRPFIRWFTDNTVDSVESFLPQTIEELEKMQKSAIIQGLDDSVPVAPEQLDPEKVQGEMLKEKIVTLIDSNPLKAALILRDWLGADKAAKQEAGKETGARGA
jgi:flagellar M-ring protein FliF